MIEVNKVALNRDDDKQISKKGGISTLARRHKSLSLYSVSYHLDRRFQVIFRKI